MPLSYLQRIGILISFVFCIPEIFIGLTYAQMDYSREARIQAVLIYKIIKFVEWPSDSLGRTEVLHVCIWGDSTTENALQIIQGQKIREHEIRVRKLNMPLDTKGCHVLYVSNNVREVNSFLLYSSGSRALLTISDAPEFNKRGGIVNLIKQDNRIGFEIQLRYAREHGLQLGAPLLELARVVD